MLAYYCRLYGYHTVRYHTVINFAFACMFKFGYRIYTVVGHL